MDFVSHFLYKAKSRVLGTYGRALNQLDPELATHLLASQREFFLAGKAFFEEEAKHAEKAMAKLKKPPEPTAADND